MRPRSRLVRAVKEMDIRLLSRPFRALSHNLTCVFTEGAHVISILPKSTGLKHMYQIGLIGKHDVERRLSNLQLLA